MAHDLFFWRSKHVINPHQSTDIFLLIPLAYSRFAMLVVIAKNISVFVCKDDTLLSAYVDGNATVSAIGLILTVNFNACYVGVTSC
jgi:hypothetical protein